MVSNDVYAMSLFRKMSYAELATWLLGTAALQEQHPFHGKSIPDWIPGPPSFRVDADLLPKAVKAAENKDVEKGKELEQLHGKILQGINMNACYIVMRSLHEKNDELLDGMGYERREKPRRNNTVLPISQVPLKVTAKRGKPGVVIITIERDPAAGLYQVQFCKGEPAGEDSWLDGGNHKRCRVIFEDLELATWHYFRVRSHGDHEVSPWSAPVGIIVA